MEEHTKNCPVSKVSLAESFFQIELDRIFCTCNGAIQQLKVLSLAIQNTRMPDEREKKIRELMGCIHEL